MSYILDALRKSDQQRQHGASPTLLTVPAAASGSKRPRYFFNTVIAAVLVCAGVVVGWLRPWQTQRPAAVAEPVASMPSAAAPQGVVPMPPSVVPESVRKAEAEPTMHESTAAQSFRPSVGAPANQGTPPVAANGSAPPLSQPGIAVQETPAMQLPEKLAPADAAAGEGKRVMALNDLPPSIQREIPNISISFHAYSSNPKERRVMINGSMVGQGQFVAPGLSLEQITPDGVILDYKGFRFHQGVR
jgi:general secretion pathway protein B